MQGQYGDTTYYLIATPVLPLLMPIDKIPLIGHPLAVTLDPFFRVLVEAGYDRTINPGEPTTAKWLYIPNPISTLVNLVVAIPTGLDNGISAITGNPDNRPFGTTEPGSVRCRRARRRHGMRHSTRVVRPPRLSPRRRPPCRRSPCSEPMHLDAGTGAEVEP